MMEGKGKATDLSRLTKQALIAEIESLRRRYDRLKKRAEKDSGDLCMYRELLENIPEVQVLKDLHDGKILYISPNYESVFHQSAEEVRKHPALFAQRIHPQDREHMMRIYRNQSDPKAQGAAFSTEYRIVLDDGSIRWISSRGYPVMDGKGSPQRLVIIARDITEHKQAAQELDRSEYLYKMLFEHSPHAITLIDPATGLAVSFNRKAHEMLEYSEEEFRNIRISDMEAKESAEETKEHFKRMLLQGYDHFETLMRTKTGRIKNVFVSVHAVNFEGKQLLFGSFQDITEVVRYRRAMEALLNASPDPMMLLTPQGDVLAINSAGTTRLMRGETDLTCMNAYAALHPTGAAIINRRMIEALIAQKHFIRYEDYRSGQHYENRLYPVQNEAGEVEKIAVFIRNITERKVMERAIEESELRYRTVVDTVPIAVQICNLAGQIVVVNTAYCQLFEATEKKLIGRFIWENLADEYAQTAFRKEFQEILTGKPEPATLYYRNRTMTGKIIELKVTWNYVRDITNQVVGFCVTMEEVTGTSTQTGLS